MPRPMMILAGDVNRDGRCVVPYPRSNVALGVAPSAGSVDGVLARPEISHYISGWLLDGDVGVVAETERPIGAAWWRFLPEEEPGYGFADSETPEITIGVRADDRSQGIGKYLLDTLICMATEQGLPGLSLSVEPENHAIRLYERMGFEVVGEIGGAVTIRRAIPASPAG